MYKLFPLARQTTNYSFILQRFLTFITTWWQIHISLRLDRIILRPCNYAEGLKWNAPLHQSQRWDLHSDTVFIKRTTAEVTRGTWRQILHELEVARATMEWQVHIWIINGKSGKIHVPRLTYRSFFKAYSVHEKIWLVFSFNAKPWKVTYKESQRIEGWVSPWSERRRKEEH